MSLLVPRCTDHIKNQDESDIDCGGTSCPKCNNGMACKIDCDCVSDVCKNKICVRKSLFFLNVKYSKSFSHFSHCIMR